MTVFELMLYACLTTHGSPFGNFGDYNKSCAWRSSGYLYETAEKCNIAGKPYVGTDIIGDTIFVGGTNRYEDVRCFAREVR